MPTIYQISGGRLGIQRDVEDDSQIPAGWTRAVPPQPGPGQFVAWAGRWVLTDRPPSPAPARQRPPQPLTKLQFVGLCQTAGGMTDAQLVAAYDDPALKPLWIKLTMATAVERDDPATVEGLMAMEALGHLPEPQAVLDAWPR